MRPHIWLSLNANVPWYGCLPIGISGAFAAPDYIVNSEETQNRQTACGVVMAAFKPCSPATVPTPQNVFDSSMATHTDIIASVPAFVEVQKISFLYSVVDQ
jgi:hypothetical protein